MKVKEALLLCQGGPKPTKFTYMVERSMTKEISTWLHETFVSFGQHYYYSHGEIWFKTAKQETWFMLRWP